MKKKPLLLVFLGIIVGAIGFGFFSHSSAKLPNYPAPQLNIPPLDNKSEGITAETFKDHVTLVSFFASWCGPCHLNHEALKHLAQNHAVRIVGINLRDTPISAQFWLLQNGNPYTYIGSDPQGTAAQAWGVRGIPQVFVVDQRGHVRFQHAGVITLEKMQKVLLPLLDKLQKKSGS